MGAAGGKIRKSRGTFACEESVGHFINRGSSDRPCGWEAERRLRLSGIWGERQGGSGGGQRGCDGHGCGIELDVARGMFRGF
jgi:hypothetical protein